LPKQLSGGKRRGGKTLHLYLIPIGFGGGKKRKAIWDKPTLRLEVRSKFSQYHREGEKGRREKEHFTLNIRFWEVNRLVFCCSGRKAEGVLACFINGWVWEGHLLSKSRKEKKRKQSRLHPLVLLRKAGFPPPLACESERAEGEEGGRGATGQQSRFR